MKSTTALLMLIKMKFEVYDSMHKNIFLARQFYNALLRRGKHKKAIILIIRQCYTYGLDDTNTYISYDPIVELSWI